jgi:hypothetical protein
MHPSGQFLLSNNSLKKFREELPSNISIARRMPKCAGLTTALLEVTQQRSQTMEFDTSRLDLKCTERTSCVSG